MRQVELTTLDVRYEGYRMRNSAVEERLLVSIAERGIEEPLEGVDTAGGSVLLNGFKRYRCARKLKLGTVPYHSMGEDEGAAIVELLRVSNNKALSILEQARFIEDLKKLHKMSVGDIAQDLSRSKAWVSMRLNLIGQMSQGVREKMFGGAFPVYSYMYTLRPFMRMNRRKGEEIEEFVEAVAGKRLSVREIEQLANGYFRGPDSVREQIRSGHIGVVLDWIRQVPQDPEGCSEFERVLLKDLEIALKYMQRGMGKSQDKRLKTRAFFAQAHLLTAQIVSRAPGFLESMRRLHDRSGQA